MSEDNKYIEIATRQIDFEPITEDKFFESPEDMKAVYEEAEQIATHPLSNIYSSNFRWALTTFNLFEFHTNFSLSDQALSVIDATPGVETVSQHTKYRGVISVGKLFDDVLVRNQIRAAITDKFKEQNENVGNLLNQMNETPVEE